MQIKWRGKVLLNISSRTGSPTTSLAAPAQWLIDAFGGKSKTGVNVTPINAMGISTIYRCVGNISEDIAKLPILFSKTEPNGDHTLLPDLPAARLLNGQASPGISSITFKQALVASAALRGNGYAYIFRDKYYQPSGLLIISPDRVMPYLYDGVITYHVTPSIWDSISGPIPATDILHIRAFTLDGIVGISPIAYALESMGISIAAQNFAATFYANGANMSGVIEGQDGESWSPDKVSRLKESFLQSINGQVGGVAVLFDGMKYSKIGMNPEEAQLLESRGFTVPEMCRWYRMPCHKVQDLTHATFSNIEEQNIEYLTDCLMTWGRRLEEEVEVKLLQESEQGIINARVNYDEFLRGNATARADFNSKMIGVGVLTPNEVRRQNYLNGYEFGDQYYIPVNLQPADKIATLTDAKIQAITIKETQDGNKQAPDSKSMPTN